MRRARARRWRASSTGSACRATPMTRSRAPATSPAALSQSRLPQTVFHLGPQRDLSIFTGPRCELRAARDAPIMWSAPACSTTRRKRRTAIATCWRRCVRARCSWSAPIPTSSSSAAIRWSIAPAPWPTPMRRSAAKCFIAASRMRRSTTRRWPRPRRCAAARAPERKRVLAIGDSVRTDLKGAAAFGLDYMFVTSGIHAEQYGSREAPDLRRAQRDLRRRRRRAEGGDARACMVS